VCSERRRYLGESRGKKLRHLSCPLVYAHNGKRPQTEFLRAICRNAIFRCSFLFVFFFYFKSNQIHGKLDRAKLLFFPRKRTLFYENNNLSSRKQNEWMISVDFILYILQTNNIVNIVCKRCSNHSFESLKTSDVKSR